VSTKPEKTKCSFAGEQISYSICNKGIMKMIKQQIHATWKNFRHNVKVKVIED
jgi:hypothetical protein